LNKRSTKKVWNLDVEKSDTSEFMATACGARADDFNSVRATLCPYKGVPRKFTVRSPSLEFLLDAVEKILMEQIEEIKRDAGV